MAGRTLKDLAKEALAVQDACNLSGVAYSFGQAMIDLRQHVQGSDESARHPITIVWLDKLNSLAGIQLVRWDSGKILRAYDAVAHLADLAEE